MPGFGEMLSETEIMAILGYIRSHWPEREQRHQARMSRREDERWRASGRSTDAPN